MQISNQSDNALTDSLRSLGLPPLDELRTRLATGARCVRFECCISAGIATLRRQSGVYLTDTWEQRYLHGMGYSLVSLLLGPWGLPWGLIWTPWAVWVNLTGGVDVTGSVLALLDGEKSETLAPLSPA